MEPTDIVGGRGRLTISMNATDEEIDAFVKLCEKGDSFQLLFRGIEAIVEEDNAALMNSCVD